MTSNIRSTLTRMAPGLFAICLLLALASVASAASVASEVLDAGKSEVSGLSDTVAMIIKIVIGLGALVGLGISIWGSVIQFNIMRLITGLGIVIVCGIGWVIVDKIATKAKAEGGKVNTTAIVVVAPPQA